MPRTRHAFDPSTERLEAHVLLSTANPAQALTGPPIAESLTTDKSAYKVGQPVRVTLTETNNTNAPVAMAAIGHGGGFSVTRDLKVVWTSRGRNQGAAASTLQPGQARTVKVVWNGRANTASTSRSTPLTGTFRIDNTLAYSTVTIVIDPRHGKSSTAGPASSVPNEALTLTS